MGRTFTANKFVTVEAQIYGRDMQPLPHERQAAAVTLKLPPGVAGRKMPKDEYNGRDAPKPGQGESRLVHRPVPGPHRRASTTWTCKVPRDERHASRAKFVVKEANPELDNTRPDFDQMYRLASEADDVLARMDGDTQRKLKQYCCGNKAAVPADTKDRDRRPTRARTSSGCTST